MDREQNIMMTAAFALQGILAGRLAHNGEHPDIDAAAVAAADYATALVDHLEYLAAKPAA